MYLDEHTFPRSVHTLEKCAFMVQLESDTKSIPASLSFSYRQHLTNKKRANYRPPCDL